MATINTLTLSEKKQINFLNVQANFKSFLLDFVSIDCRKALVSALLLPNCIVDPEFTPVISIPKSFNKTELKKYIPEISKACEALKVQYWKELEELNPVAVQAIQEVLF